MTGTVAIPQLPPPADPPAPGPVDLSIESEGFFPSVDLNALREAVRLDSNVSAERLRLAAQDAVIAVRRELRTWRLARQDDGAESLADVDDEEVDGQNVLELLYRRAVYSLTAADLKDALGDLGATQSGLERAEELASTADIHRRNYRWAVSDILAWSAAACPGEGRAVIELI